jgi:excisionase family DNA binding protein
MSVEVPNSKEASMIRSAADTATIQILPTGRGRSTGVQSLRVKVEPDERLLLTVSEAARRLGIGRSLLYELLADGQIESIHVGRLRRIPAEALVDYVDRQRRSALGLGVGATGSVAEGACHSGWHPRRPPGSFNRAAPRAPRP